MRDFIAIAAIIFGLASFAYADGEVKNSDWIAQPDEPQMPTEPKAPHVKNSAAEYDKRLPPTLPGEVVETKGGKMKVWSSSGPVPVASAPEPWKDRGVNVGNGEDASIGVIIDRREGKRDR